MFITLEGPEGSGKSTQIQLLANYLREMGKTVVVTREPGGTRIGDQIRRCLHDVENTEMVPMTEILLYSASRAQLVRELIRPALERGEIVLCDRYIDSTIAYQGYGRGLNLIDLWTITHLATGGLKPDLTLLLDLDVRQGLDRRMDSGLEMNRLDLETISFHERVRTGYLKIAEEDPKRWLMVNADQPVSDLQKELRQQIDRFCLLKN